jgi:hypothetical protein
VSIAGTLFGRCDKLAAIRHASRVSSLTSRKYNYSRLLLVLLLPDGLDHLRVDSSCWSNDDTTSLAVEINEERK